MAGPVDAPALQVSMGTGRGYSLIEGSSNIIVCNKGSLITNYTGTIARRFVGPSWPTTGQLRCQGAMTNTSCSGVAFQGRRTFRALTGSSIGTDQLMQARWSESDASQLQHWAWSAETKGSV